MTRTLFQKSVPHILAILAFLLISIAYFPDYLEGKRMKASDWLNWQGMAKEVHDFREATGEEALWTNSMFGGMPAYLISMKAPGNLVAKVHQIFDFKSGFRPVSFIFSCMLVFYLSMLVFGARPWLAAAGGVAYAFSSYFFIVIAAGHISKVQALIYLPGIIAGVYMTYRQNRWLGAVLTGVFLALQLLVNHLQITYYTMMVVVIFVLFECYRAVKEGKTREFLLSSVSFIIPVLLAVGANATTILTTLEYGKYSTRGQSELTHNQENKTSGLDRDYITAWSYGIDETMTLLIPNFKGGSSHGPLTTKSETYKVLQQSNVPNARQIIKQLPLYFGDQPFTSGPVYAGALIVFLFVLGLWILPGPTRWFVISVTLLAIFLSWGRHWMGFTNIFLDYLPGYNKFRAVSMILIIPGYILPLVAVLVIKKISDGAIAREKLMKSLKYSLYAVGGICLLVSLFPGIAGPFSSPSDSQMGWPEFLIDALVNDRESMVRTDAFRSLIFVLLGGAWVWAFASGKLKAHFAFPLLVVMILADLWPVNKRFLNSQDFVPKREINTPYKATAADLFILEDKDPAYRVLDLASNTFNSSRASYFHHSVGGYHGAKMGRYQELIDFHIAPSIQAIAQTFNEKATPGSIDSVLFEQKVLSMLNMKYLIYNLEAMPLLNNHATGPVWFASDIRWVANADEEIQALGEVDPTSIVLVDERYKELVAGYTPGVDSLALIRLVEYKPNNLVYEVQAPSNQLAVFSEIFYSKGWNAYVDGELWPHFRANYVLRAMMIPAGASKVEFKFEPASYTMGNQVAWASSSLLLLLLVGTVWMTIRRKES